MKLIIRRKQCVSYV